VDTPSSCRTLAGGTAAAIPCKSAGDVLKAVVQQLTTGCPPKFTWARLDASSMVATDVQKLVEQVYSSMPKDCLLIIVLCPSTEGLRNAHKVRTTRGDPRCTLLWDKKQQANLEIVAAKAQSGLVWAIAK